MILLATLDPAPTVAGGDAASTWRQGLDLARHAEAWDCRRVWLAGQHGRGGQRGPLPRPMTSADLEAQRPPQRKAGVQRMLALSAVHERAVPLRSDALQAELSA